MTVLYSTSYVFILITTFQTYAGLAVLRHPRDNSCSSRPDMTCTTCNGIPECFDLSDELGCPNMTFKLIPIQKATKACMDKSCQKVFPGPPPLPPFSLCGDMQPRTTTETSTTITTKPTTGIPSSQTTTKSTTGIPSSQTTKKSTTGIPSSQIITKSTTETHHSRVTTVPTYETSSPKITTQATTDMSSSYITTQPRTRSTCKTTRTPITTKPPYNPTTHWWDLITFDRPTVRTTTTIPPWTSTHWASTLNPALKRSFMEMWRSCASVYDTNRAIFSCTVNCYFRPCRSRGFSNCYNSCVPFLDNRRRNFVATTAASMFRAVPTQLFPTARYVTNTNNWFGQSESSDTISATDMSYIFMLSEMYNK